jgi:hypothetical protein
MRGAATPNPCSRAPALRRGAWALLGAVVAPTAIAAGCGRQTAPAPAASASASVAATAASAPLPAGPLTTQRDEDVKPVYPLEVGPPNPVAEKLCDAVQGLVERRRAECCAIPSYHALLTRECVRMLTFALREKAVTLEPAAVDRCSEATKKVTAGCDWVGPSSLPMPAECRDLLKGALQQGAPCRSSLECEGSLRCQGLSATRMGKCGPPKSDKRMCRIGIDPLAVSTRQDNVDKAHPECVGRCVRKQCEPAVAAGAACKTDTECATGRCLAGKCNDALLPVEGAACVDGRCGDGFRCVDQKCAAPKAEGASCAVDEECRARCVRPEGASEGKCEKQCPTLRVPNFSSSAKAATPRPSAAPPRK